MPRKPAERRVPSEVVAPSWCRFARSPWHQPCRLEVDLADDVPTALGVESEIREALINLVFNAVDAMPEGGVLALRTRAGAPGGAASAMLEVSDSGVGMDEETRRRCFEPFFTSKGERGTGLGLAMVYGVVQRHGADIDIDSGVGRGTTVRVRFDAAPAAQTTEAIEVVSVARSMRILIVDDDPVLLHILQATLEGDGHRVVAAGSGQAGIEAFAAAQEKGQGFTLVMTDLGMPCVDGRKVASAVKRMSPATPVLLLTGWGRGLDGEAGSLEHVDEVLSKPPKLRELRQALARHGRPADNDVVGG